MRFKMSIINPALLTLLALTGVCFGEMVSGEGILVCPQQVYRNWFKLRFPAYGIDIGAFEWAKGYVSDPRLMLDGAAIALRMPRLLVADKEVYGEKTPSRIVVTDNPALKTLSRMVKETETYSDLRQEFRFTPTKISLELSWTWKAAGGQARVLMMELAAPEILKGLTYEGVDTAGHGFNGTFTLPAKPDLIPAEGHTLLPEKDGSLKEVTFHQTAWMVKFTPRPDKSGANVKLLKKSSGPLGAMIIVVCDYDDGKKGEQRSFGCDWEVKRK